MRKLFFLMILGGGSVVAVVGAEPAPPRGSGSYEVMDYGPVIGQSVRGVASKALAIRLGPDQAVLFDTELLRYAAGTRGGWVDLSKTDLVSYKGNDVAAIEGRPFFLTEPIPGWARDQDFSDPRPEKLGNLPRDWGRYEGFYRHGERVILSYRVGDVEVLDMAEELERGDCAGLVRTLRVGAAAAPTAALVAGIPAGGTVTQASMNLVVSDSDGQQLVIRLLGTDGEGARLEVSDDRVALHLPAERRARTVRIVIAEAASEQARRLAEMSEEELAGPVPDLPGLIEGGPARWPEEIARAGELGSEDWAYAVDTIPLPFENPWGSWFRPTGFDFFADGKRAAMSTWNGDVWIVSGLDETLEGIRWRRFASGLFYSAGLAIVDDEIYVVERSQTTRLHDLNGNGEADFYENFNNDVLVHGNAHSLTLHVDSKKNFYYFKNGNRVPAGVPQHGAVIRLSPDGERHEVFATGIRGANGMGIGPDDMILAADQEGNWVPATRIDRIERGKFYGYRPHGGEGLPVGEFEPPICWVPHRVDNSAGDLAHAGERWGIFANRWVHTSYGQCHLFLLLKEEVNGQLQGGLVKFPLSFESGLMRARVNPRDGQLYVMGMKGWQTLGQADGSLNRLRYTGRPAHLPVEWRTFQDGVQITFSDPVDPMSASDPRNYEAQRWNYRYSSRYGSPEYSAADPSRENHRDAVEVRAVALGPDGKTVYLHIPEIEPVMQMRIGYRIRTLEQEELENEIHYTIHQLNSEALSDSVIWPERLEPVSNELSGSPAAGETVSIELGRRTYQMFCAVCHQPNGQGLTGVAPSLHDSPWVKGPDEVLIRILLHGKRGEQTMMIPFGWLNDGQIASTLAYIRKEWGEGASEADMLEMIPAIRKSTAQRQTPWTEEELREYLPGR